MCVCVSRTDGERVAYNTLIEALLIDKCFKLVINNTVYDVHAPEKGTEGNMSALNILNVFKPERDRFSCMFDAIRPI